MAQYLQLPSAESCPIMSDFHYQCSAQFDEQEVEILQALGVGPDSATKRWPCRKNMWQSAMYFFIYSFQLYAKICGETKWVKSRSRRKKRRILQGPGVGPGFTTECWPSRKMRENHFFSHKKIKITSKNIFFRYSFQLYQNIGGKFISVTGVSPKWVKSVGKEEEKEKRNKSR